MAVPPSELNETDFKILRYICKFDSVSKERIAKKFSKIDHLDFLLSRLSEVERGANGIIPIANSSYIVEHSDKISHSEGAYFKPNGIFSITDYGKSAMHSNKVKSKAANKDFWKNSIITPYSGQCGNHISNTFVATLAIMDNITILTVVTFSGSLGSGNNSAFINSILITYSTFSAGLSSRRSSIEHSKISVTFFKLRTDGLTKSHLHILPVPSSAFSSMELMEIPFFFALLTMFW